MLRPAFWAGLIVACALLVACGSAATKGDTASLDRVPQASAIRTIAQGEVIGTSGAADTMAMVWNSICCAAGRRIALARAASGGGLGRPI